MSKAKVMTTAPEPAPGSEAFTAALAHMTDQAIAQRVRDWHPHAASSPAATKAMLDDYDRLVAEKASVAAKAAG